jgi:hypothetical protein
VAVRAAHTRRGGRGHRRRSVGHRCDPDERQPERCRGRLVRRRVRRQRVVDATNGADSAKITGGRADGVAISGLQALVRLSGTDGTRDALSLKALDGDDTVDASGLEDGVVTVTVDGGGRHDVIARV